MITGYRLKFDEMKLRKILEFNFEDFYSPPEMENLIKQGYIVIFINILN